MLTHVNVVQSPVSDLAEVDDEALARAFLDGDERAPRVVWDRFSPMVRRILRRSLGPAAEVEDLLQEVFLRVHQKTPGLRNPKVFRAFIISIATFEARHELRRRWVRQKLGLKYEQASPLELRVVHPDPDGREALLRFYRILDRLNARDRTAFVLRFMEGLELTEVADAIGVSVATTKRCLTHAWTRIRRHVERDPYLVDYLAPLAKGTDP